MKRLENGGYLGNDLRNSLIFRHPFFIRENSTLNTFRNARNPIIFIPEKIKVAGYGQFEDKETY